MHEFLGGAVTMAHLTIGLFFLSFWMKTKDRLFLMFCGAFCLMGVERLFSTLWIDATEIRPLVYILRLMAFVLILIAIVDKNRSHSAS